MLRGLLLLLLSQSGAIVRRCPTPRSSRPQAATTLIPALALALTSGRALARSQAAETMSKIVTERLVAELEVSGFVVMRKPIVGGSAPRNTPAGWPYTPKDRLRRPTEAPHSTPQFAPKTS
jgi:hypothetical protein